MFRLFLSGLFMGSADIIPGVSGGTIAFIMGIYKELISSISQFWKRLDFLVPLGLGMLVAIGTLASGLQYLLGHEVYRVWLYCVFFGLILASIWFCARQIIHWHIGKALLILAGAVVAFTLTTIDFEPQSTYELIVRGQEVTHVTKETLAAMQAKGIIDADTPVHKDGYTYALKELTLPVHSLSLDGWLIFCGAVAVSAMLLPGISGSYMLVIMGAYPLVIGAIADLVRGDVEALWPLTSLAIGIFVGAVVFSRFVNWLLKKYQSGALATLTGFMIGALPAVWPFWSIKYALDPLHLEKGAKLQPIEPILPEIDSPVFLVGLALALVGFLLVIVMERASSEPFLSEA